MGPVHDCLYYKIPNGTVMLWAACQHVQGFMGWMFRDLPKGVLVLG